MTWKPIFCLRILISKVVIQVMWVPIYPKRLLCMSFHACSKFLGFSLTWLSFQFAPSLHSQTKRNSTPGQPELANWKRKGSPYKVTDEKPHAMCHWFQYFPTVWTRKDHFLRRYILAKCKLALGLNLPISLKMAIDLEPLWITRITSQWFDLQDEFQWGREDLLQIPQTRWS